MITLICPVPNLVVYSVTRWQTYVVYFLKIFKMQAIENQSHYRPTYGAAAV